MDHRLAIVVLACACTTPTSPTVPTSTTGSNTTARTGDTGDACTWRTPDPEPVSGRDAAIPIAACRSPRTDAHVSASDTWQATLTVAETGVGTPPTECHHFFASGSFETEPEWVWFRGTDTASASWVFGWQLEDAPPAPAKGTTVLAVVNDFEKRYVTDDGLALTVTQRSNGRVVASVAAGLPGVMLQGTGLSVTPAGSVGGGRDSCSSWSFEDATVGSASVPWGAMVDLTTGYRVAHGGLAAPGPHLLKAQGCKKCDHDYTLPNSAFALYPTPTP